VTGALAIVVPGPFTTVQDLGRVGRGHQGIARSGAFDHDALMTANRLVGNPPDAAALEVLLGPIQFTARRDLVLACAGTDALVRVEHARFDTGSTEPVSRSTHCAYQGVFVGSGSSVTIGPATVGLRTIVAIRGGIDTEKVLGSRSYDSLGLIGPAPLRAGDEVAIGSCEPVTDPWLDIAPRRADNPIIEFTLGPRDPWLESGGVERLLGQEWVVDPGSNRTGVRLLGEPVPRRGGELASEAMILGAIQLPASGLPIVLGPDGGTTGGYPVVGVLTRAGVDRLAQARPGDRISLRLART
jgi:biotin-dependent carboxylase-like uncharacterized protein